MVVVWRRPVRLLRLRCVDRDALSSVLRLSCIFSVLIPRVTGCAVCSCSGNLLLRRVLSMLALWHNAAAGAIFQQFHGAWANYRTPLIAWCSCCIQTRLSSAPVYGCCTLSARLPCLLLIMIVVDNWTCADFLLPNLTFEWTPSRLRGAGMYFGPVFGLMALLNGIIQVAQIGPVADAGCANAIIRFSRPLWA
eukprot:COSAG02_NODE_3724_length_6321_cov_1.932819_5_plen_193_part_00